MGLIIRKLGLPPFFGVFFQVSGLLHLARKEGILCVW